MGDRGIGKLLRNGQPSMVSRVITALKANGEMTISDLCDTIGVHITVQSAIKTSRSRISIGRQSSKSTLDRMIRQGRRRLIGSVVGTMYRDKIVCRVSRGKYRLCPEFDV